jgi:hypothetical protein
MTMTIRWTAGVLVWMGLTTAAMARDLFVDQAHPMACDTNSGTQAQPFKTIQAGVDAVLPGETVWVKAGIYEEAVKIAKSGRTDRRMTLSAWGNDRVRIGSILRKLPPADQWKPIPNCKSWAVQLPEDPPKGLQVIIDERPVVTQATNTPPPDKEVLWATYRAADRTLMVNVGGDNPAAAHKLSLARYFQGLRIDENHGWWTVRRIEFGWLYGGIGLAGHDVLVEDCYFHHTYRPAIFLYGSLNTMRRCSFYHCGIALEGGGTANIIEESLVVGCGQTWDQDIHHRASGNHDEVGPVCFKGTAYGQIFRYNIIADNTGSLWYDGCANGVRVIGNAFQNNQHGNGVYNEYSTDDSLYIGNYFFGTSFSSSWSTRTRVEDNFFQGGSVTWHNQDVWPYRHSRMVLLRNAFVDIRNGYVHNFGVGYGPANDDESYFNSIVDYNRVRIQDGASLAMNGKDRYMTIESLRTNLGWEIHGEVKPYAPENNDLTPEAMGGSEVTFRVPWGPRANEARPMLSDARIDGRWPAAAEVAGTFTAPPFFWKVGDGTHATLYRGGNWFDGEWQMGSPFRPSKDETLGCQWLVDADDQDPAKPVSHDGNRSERSHQNRFLLIRGLTPTNIPPQGLGYWSSTLAAAPGAAVRVSLKMRGRDIVSTVKGTPAVWLQFTDETGQNPTRVFLVGRDERGTVHRPDLTDGSYDWKEVSGTAVAPSNAIRMALFMGILPCKGEVHFDDITIKTETAPKSGAAAATEEALPPRLPLQRIREVHYIDLSTVVNRSLADEVAGDGQGGWSDQGGAADLREFKTGERKFGGVPFKILPAPKSIVVLKGGPGKTGGLPSKVSIPVNRKLDTLFFLQAAPWGPPEDKEGWRYVIHYKDGKDVVLPVSGKNIWDWTGAPVRRFPKEEMTCSTAAETVPVPQFGQGTVYRMEWNSPADRRVVDIDRIEFISANISVPILLGITGVSEY